MDTPVFSFFFVSSVIRQVRDSKVAIVFCPVPYSSVHCSSTWLTYPSSSPSSCFWVYLVLLSPPFFLPLSIAVANLLLVYAPTILFAMPLSCWKVTFLLARFPVPPHLICVPSSWSCLTSSISTFQMPPVSLNLLFVLSMFLNHREPHSRSLFLRLMFSLPHRNSPLLLNASFPMAILSLFRWYICSPICDHTSKAAKCLGLIPISVHWSLLLLILLCYCWFTSYLFSVYFYFHAIFFRCGI